MAAHRPARDAIPEDALRTIAEAADSWRGQPAAFVVYNTSTPYEVVSVHSTEREAKTAAESPGKAYFGPVTPKDAASAFRIPRKQIGCVIRTLGQRASEIVASVVLLDSDGNEVGRFTVDALGKKRPPEETDIEALFLTPSGVDKFLMPYLARVYGAAYAAYQRNEWITD